MGRAQTGVRFRNAVAASWNAMATDVAANTMTYLGVLLAIVVIFAFFAFGYFGDVIRIKNLRPLVELAVPLTFFGLATVLRKRTGTSHAATAVALIGALTIPVMLSASFRDGSLCCPPDLNGPPRWAGYAAAGLASAVVYAWLAKRERVFAYLVGPALWAAVGAIGLYVTFGVSGYQLFIVIVAMGATLYVASRLVETAWGSILAVPIARMAIVGGPIVFVIAVIFAYGDVSNGGKLVVEDLAAPSAFAAWAAVALLAGASTSTFAWSELSENLRTAAMRGVRGAAYVMAGMAVVYTMGLGIAMEWAGPFVVAYGFFVYGLDRKLGGAGNIPLLVARVAVVGGSVVSLADPLVGFVTWTGLAVGAGFYLVNDRFRGLLDPLMPAESNRSVSTWAAWVTIVVAMAQGAFDVIGGFKGVAMLLVGATLAGLSRTARGRLAPLSTYATVPATALVGLGFVLLVSVSQQLSVSESVGAFVLLGFAAAAVRLPWVLRAPVVYVAAISALSLSLGELQSLTNDFAGALTLVAAGVFFITGSLRPQWRTHAVVNGVIGNLSLYAALGVLGDPGARIVVLTGLVVLNAAQGAAIERRSCALFSVIARRYASWRAVVRAWPSSIAAVALLPLAMTVATFSSFDDRVTTTVLVAGLGWLYAASLWSRVIRSRTLGIFLAYGAVGFAILASLPVSWLATLAALSGTLTLVFIAMALRKPSWTLPAWMLATIVVAFGAFSAGASVGSLNDWVFGWVASILVAVAVVNGRPGSGGVSSLWLRPPVALAIVVMPAATVFALVDDSGVVILATIAAVVFAFFGYRTRAAAVSVPVSAFTALAYAASIGSEISLIEDPVGWVPLIAGLGVAAAVLPGRGRWRVLTEPSPGVLGATYVVAGVALLSSPGTGWESTLLVVWAALMVLTRIIFDVLWARYAALVVLLLAGVIGGEGWAAGSVLVVGAVLAASAGEFDGVVAAAHRWAAMVNAFVGIALVGVWQQWTPEFTVSLALMSGGVLTLVSMGLDLRAHAHPQLRCWWMPLAGAGQGAMAVAVFFAAVGIEPGIVPGVLFTVFAIEGVAAATYALVRIDERFAAACVAFFAAAYGALALWLPWTNSAAITTTVLLAASTAGAATFIHLGSDRARTGMWWRPMAGVGHVGMWTTVGLGAMEGVDWVLMTAAAFTVESVIGVVYAEKRKWEAAAWVAVVSGLGAVAAIGEVAGSSTNTIVLVGFVTGVVLAGMSVVLDVFRDGERPAMWWRPMAVVGHLSAASSAGLALADWTFNDAMLMVAAFSLFEALVLGLYAVVRDRVELAWVSSAAVGVAAASGVVGIDLARTEIAAAFLAIGSMILVVWTVLMRSGQTSPRVSMWLWPGFVLAEVALGVGGLILFDIASQPVGSFSVAGVLAINGLAISVVATARRLQILAIASVGLGAAAYAVALYAFEPSRAAAMVGIWVGTVTLGLAAAWFGRRTGDLARMWANACALVTPVGIGGMLVPTSGAEGDFVTVGFAAACLTASAIVWLNQGIIETVLNDELDSGSRESKFLAAVFLVLGMGSLALWYPEAASSIAPLLATAALGIIGARIWSMDDANASALVSWMGLAIVSQLGAARLFEVVSVQSSAVLAVNSVGFLAVGILSVRHRFAMVGVVGLIGALAGLVNDMFDLATHTTIVLVAVAILAVLESERLLRKREGREYTDVLRMLEWIAISAPLVLAAVEMLDNLNFGLLMVIEGAALIIWGFASRITRRVIVGLAGVITAITIGVVTPVVSGVREGFGSGGWLITGAVMAVVFIVAGSNISKYRASFGRQLGRIGSVLEDWE